MGGSALTLLLAHQSRGDATEAMLWKCLERAGWAYTRVDAAAYCTSAATSGGGEDSLPAEARGGDGKGELVLLRVEMAAGWGGPYEGI